MYHELKQCSLEQTIDRLNKIKLAQALNKVAENTKCESCEKEVEIRTDKVDLIRERMKIGYYFNKKIIAQIADKLLKELGLD